MIHDIYALVDSRDGKPFYVGISVFGQLRKQQHKANSKKGKTATSKRINEIANAGGSIIMLLIEIVVSLEEAQEREYFWISCYQAAGYELTNTAKIGRGINQSPYEAIAAYPLIPLLTQRQYIALHKLSRSPYHNPESDTKRYLVEKGYARYTQNRGIAIVPLGLAALDRYRIYESFVFRA